MKKIFALLCSALFLFSATSCQKKAQKLLLGGSGWDKIVIINKNTKEIEWEHPLEKGWECNSVAATPDGNILFSYARGAKVITREHQEVWNIPAPDTCEMQTARVLPNGNYLLAWVGHPAVIMEVSPKGDILSRTEYETGIEQPHAQFRQVNKNERGNYLIPLFATSDVREVSQEGKLLKATKLEGTPFSTYALSNGNYWVACGDGHSLLEVNLDNGEVARRYGENDIKGARLFFVAQLLPAYGEGLYICNWQGHDKNAKDANSPQLLEIDGNGRVVWSLNDNEKFGMISAISPI
ncbi:hypothetical protein ACGE0T_11350 [Parabacteroides sp. APC149_11_2_Y6]